MAKTNKRKPAPRNIAGLAQRNNAQRKRGSTGESEQPDKRPKSKRFTFDQYFLQLDKFYKANNHFDVPSDYQRE